MPRIGSVEAYVKKAYAAQQETLNILEKQLGEWQRHVAGTLAGQRAARVWVEEMIGTIRNLVSLSEDLGSMRRFLTALRARDVRTGGQNGPG